MKILRAKPRIGLRTLKTAAAVTLSMITVNFFGSTSSKLIFAMLGAMTAVQPTFKESLESSLGQIIGVIFGALAGVLLLLLNLHPLVSTGIGIVLIITLYNIFKINASPSLPCLILVILCTGSEVTPFLYALGRIWDTAIGLAIGMLINMLIFPYDNSRKIRSTVESLDKELIRFLEDMFDGNEILPDAEMMTAKIDDMAAQLQLFSNQRLILHLRRQRKELEQFRACQGKARELVAQMEVLCRMEIPGRLTVENRQQLADCGAKIQDSRTPDTVTESDVVTNYHVAQILTLRRELLDALKK